MEWKLLIIYSLIYLLLFAVVEIAYHKLSLSSELTRKVIHIFSGLLALTFPLFFEEFLSVIILCSLFLIILFSSKRLGLLASINDVERKTKGSIFFPVIVCFCFYIFEEEQLYVYYYLPILILAICDPMAALIGKKFGFGSYLIIGNKKTIAGNLGFFTSCLFISVLAMLFSFPDMILNPLIAALTLALVCTIAEGISIHGYDNLTIPLTVIGVLYTFKEFLLV